jgi:hypothetical protein
MSATGVQLYKRLEASILLLSGELWGQAHVHADTPSGSFRDEQTPQSAPAKPTCKPGNQLTVTPNVQVIDRLPKQPDVVF